MSELDRRQFLRFSAAAGAFAALAGSHPVSAAKPMRLGLFVGVEKDPAAALARVRDLGFPTCQVAVEGFSPAVESGLKNAMQKYGIEVTALDSLGPGPHVWDFYQGPLTIGLVPREYRRQRIDHFKKASDFAKKLGIRVSHPQRFHSGESQRSGLQGSRGGDP